MLTQDRSLFQDELSGGERLLWNGQPKQGLMLRVNDLFLIPFSLFWGGFVIVWEFQAINSGAPLFFKLWGIPFLLVGFYITVGRFFGDAYQRAKTYYAVTNERVIIISGLLNRNVRTLTLKTLPEISLNIKGNGRGTITFGASLPMASWSAGLAWPGMGNISRPLLKR